jgi:hypothetical protein
MCSGRRFTKERSLAVVAPEVAATWHATRNGRLRPEDVMAVSGRRVWWQCPKGLDHEWKVSVASRREHRNCPFCINRRLSSTNSLATVNKAVAREWHPNKNGNLRPSDVVYGSSKLVWWQCQRGHEWLESIGYRTSRGTGCSGCRFDDRLQRSRHQGKLRPVDRTLLAVIHQAPLHRSSRLHH